MVWMHDIPGLMLGPLMVVGGTLFAVAGVRLARRNGRHLLLKENNEVAGFVFATLGVTYAVILAFVTIVVWEDFDVAQHTVEREAANPSNLHRNCAGLPEPGATALRSALASYAVSVADVEWASLRHGRAHPSTDSAYVQVWRALLSIAPSTDREVAFYTQSVERLNALANERRFRLLESRSGIHGVMWTLLVGGGFVTVAFTFLFGTRHAWAHYTISGSLAALVAFVLFLILALDHPFAGVVRVTAEPFIGLTEQWGATHAAMEGGR